jgi:hypothetical protein
LVRDLVVNVVRGLIVDVVEDAATEESAGGLIEILPKLIAMPLHVLCPLRRVSDTKKRDFASSVTTRDTVSSGARS